MCSSQLLPLMLHLPKNWLPTARILGFAKLNKAGTTSSLQDQARNALISSLFSFIFWLSNEIPTWEAVLRVLVSRSEAPSLVFSHLSPPGPSGFLITVWKPAYVFSYHVSETVKKLWRFLLVLSLEKILSVQGCEIITSQAAREQSHRLCKLSASFCW